ncbi:MAG: diacylglycerol kinase family protein [Bacteroidota bacterium]|jgi:YegS/Rv2252/BmrU family lipid kinase
MYKQQELGIILNPAAGRGRAGDKRKELIFCLQKRKIPFQLELTREPGHAKEIAFRMSEIFETIVAAGGDGTINEVVSGVVGRKATIAILPLGSGNDFRKVIGISRKIDHAIDAIIDGKRKLLDLGKVRYWNHWGEKKERYFINTLGIGLDAEIAKETKQIKFLRGVPLYLLAAIKALQKHSPNEYKITEEKTTKVERAFLICAGNGCFEGGGFKLLPNANPNDSLLDICILGVMPIHKAISIIPKLINGTHENLQKVSMWKSKEFTIEANNAFIIHGDGEIFEENTLRAEVKLAPIQISFMIPKGQVNEL